MEEVMEQKRRQSAGNPFQERLRPYWPQAVGVGVALVLSALAVWGATGFTRPAPAAPASPPGLTVAEGTIDLAATAAHWRVLTLGAAAPVAAQWTDGIPAWVHIDETLASKVGTPLSGRVTRVFVELGQAVHAGSPLYAVSSPEIA